MWVAGIRNGVMYKVHKRPLDPRWSVNELQGLLGLCATALSLGWNETRAFITAEAIIIRKFCTGIVWDNKSLMQDIKCLESTTGPEETASGQEEPEKI
jgi:hypothetical protein